MALKACSGRKYFNVTFKNTFRDFVQCLWLKWASGPVWNVVSGIFRSENSLANCGELFYSQHTWKILGGVVDQGL